MDVFVELEDNLVGCLVEYCGGTFLYFMGGNVDDHSFLISDF